MKLIFQQRKQHAISIQKRKQRRAKKSRIKKRRHTKHLPWWTDSINAPQIFSILDAEHRLAVLRFIQDIRNASKHNAVIRLNFRDTIRMYADATLLFKASIEQIHQQNPYARIKFSPAKKSLTNEVLTQTKILDRCGQTFNINPQDETVIHWKIAAGKGADGAKCEPILSHYDDTLGDKMSQGLYLGLTEAMTNTCHHAYPTLSPATEWWMFSQIKDNWLTVAICDLGVGIPATIHTKQPLVWQVIRRAYKDAATDAQIIDATIRLKRTRTRKGHRGKGLTQLANVIDRAHAGSGFYIYSGKGCYAKSHGKVTLYDYKTPIGGTVITWRLPFNPDAL